MFGKMFSFLDDFERENVGHDENGEVIIDTCLVPDGVMPYETAICHPEYNDGDWIIVEAYDNRDDAELGHKKWTETMMAETPPDTLKDCCNAMLGQLVEALSDERELIFPRVMKG